MCESQVTKQQMRQPKKTLDEEIQHNEKYPPQDLIKWMKQQEKWERSTSTRK
jgi:cytochrome c-type biogenesis protein CcmE